MNRKTATILFNTFCLWLKNLIFNLVIFVGGACAIPLGSCIVLVGGYLFLMYWFIVNVIRSFQSSKILVMPDYKSLQDLASRLSGIGVFVETDSGLPGGLRFKLAPDPIQNDDESVSQAE